MSRDYRKIKAWKIADDLAVVIYEATKNFPREEVYGITSQLRRAITSVPANIAEGASRGHKKEYLQFLNISKGSLAEADYFCHLSNRLSYINSDDYLLISKKLDELGAVLSGLIKAVREDMERKTSDRREQTTDNRPQTIVAGLKSHVSSQKSQVCGLESQ